MNKKVLLSLVSLFLCGQMVLLAQEEVKPKPAPVAQSGGDVRKAAIGIDGGWNQNYTFGAAGGAGYTKGTGRLGLNLMIGQMVNGAMPKKSYEYSAGYIFAEPIETVGFAWGIYFHATMHRNYRLNNSNSYFYTGYGVGFDLIDNDAKVYDADVQFARIPLGFKFLSKSGAEFFIEANVSLGMSINSFEVGGTYIGGSSYEEALAFSMNTDFKAGIRYWI